MILLCSICKNPEKYAGVYKRTTDYGFQVGRVGWCPECHSKREDKDHWEIDKRFSTELFLGDFGDSYNEKAME